jgi:hypothetical protein
MKIRSNCRKREDGFVLVIAMLLLVVLTVIGIAATQTSIFEIKLSNAEKKKQAAFYAAEAGLEHGRVLVEPIARSNIDYDPSDQASLVKPLSFTPLLNGSIPGWNAAGEGDNRFENGVVIVQDQTIGDGYTYNVRLLNNRADPAADDDTDGLVILASVATKPGGGASRVEIGIKAFPDEFMESDYNQGGGSAGKGNTNTDKGAADILDVQNANKVEVNRQLGS